MEYVQQLRKIGEFIACGRATEAQILLCLQVLLHFEGKLPKKLPKKMKIEQKEQKSLFDLLGQLYLLKKEGKCSEKDIVNSLEELRQKNFSLDIILLPKGNNMTLSK